MPKQLAAFFQRLGGSVRAFSAAQKTIAILAIAVLALGAVFLGTWLSTPQYTPLFTGLAAADASAVVDQLNADGVKYQLTDGGATVLVPQDKKLGILGMGRIGRVIARPRKPQDA